MRRFLEKFPVMPALAGLCLGMVPLSATAESPVAASGDWQPTAVTTRAPMPRPGDMEHLITLSRSDALRAGSFASDDSVRSLGGQVDAPLERGGDLRDELPRAAAKPRAAAVLPSPARQAAPKQKTRSLLSPWQTGIYQ